MAVRFPPQHNPTRNFMTVIFTKGMLDRPKGTWDVNGPRVPERWYIDGLDPTQETIAQCVAWAYAGRLPVFGTRHSILTGLIATVISFEPWPKDSKTSCVQDIIYAPPDYTSLISPIASLTATTRMVRTNFDAQGNVIKVFYKPSGSNTNANITGELELPLAYSVLQYDQVEYANPFFKKSYENTVNSSSWMGDPAYTWWLRELRIVKQLYVGGYRCSYVFEYNPLTWIDIAAYRNSLGQVPTDVDPVPVPRQIGTGGSQKQKNGWTSALVRGTSNFNQLGLLNINTL